MSYNYKPTTHTIILHILASQDGSVNEYDLQCLIAEHSDQDITEVIFRRTIADLRKAGLINVNLMVLECAIGKITRKMYSVRKCK